MNHQYLLLLLACVWIGCATVQSNDGNPSSTSDAPVDSSREDAQTVSSTAGSARHSISALRSAYLHGDYERVIRGVRERLRDSLSQSTTSTLYTLLGQAQQARRQHEHALKSLQAARANAFETDRSLVHLDRALGESYAALRRWSLAASAFHRVLETDSTDWATRQALAEVYRRARRWKDAKQQYERLVRRDSTNGQWWARLANCEIELGQVGRAIPHFAQAHRLQPQSADVALTLSRFYQSTFRTEKAQRVVDTTLSYRAGDSRLWRRRADLAFKQEQLGRSRRAYRRALATGDSSATLYRRIGLIDVKNQQYQRALSSLRRSYQRDSTHTRTALYLGISYLRVDSLQQASAYLQRTIDLETQGPITEALMQKGNLHNQRGNMTAAIQAYQTARRLRPSRTDVYFHLAHVYDEYYRDKTTAARYYRRFLRASDSTQQQLRSYAQNRLTSLRGALHMQEGLPSDSMLRK